MEFSLFLLTIGEHSTLKLSELTGEMTGSLTNWMEIQLLLTDQVNQANGLV